MSAFEVLSVRTSQGTGDDAAITATPAQATANRSSAASASGSLGAAIVETQAGAGDAFAARAAKLPPFVR